MTCNQLVLTCIKWNSENLALTCMQIWAQPKSIQVHASHCKSIQVGGQTKRKLNARWKRALTCKFIWPGHSYSIDCKTVPFFALDNWVSAKWTCTVWGDWASPSTNSCMVLALPRPHTFTWLSLDYPAQSKELCSLATSLQIQGMNPGSSCMEV